MAGNDPMLCAPCRVGDHRSHTEDGCHSENNLNGECECPVAPMTRNRKATGVERFEPDIEVRPGEQPTPLSTNEDLEPENHIPVMVPFPRGRWVRFADYERAIARVDPPAAPPDPFNDDRCMFCGGKTEHRPDCDHGGPSPVAATDAETFAAQIVGTVFDNTAASHETLKATMIERIADAVRAPAPSDSSIQAAAAEILDWLNFDTTLDSVQSDIAGVAAILSKRLGSIKKP